MATADTLGIPQVTGTCWFNSVINGIIFGKNGKEILEYFLNNNKENTKFYTMICNIYNYAYQIKNISYCQSSTSPPIIKNGAKELMCSMGKRTRPLIFCDGGSPNKAFISLLEDFFHFKHAILDYKLLKTPTINNGYNMSPSPLFLIFQKEYGNNLLASPFPSLSTFCLGKNDIPDEISFNNHEYVLEHAVESIFTSGRHAIACGFVGKRECRYDSNKRTDEIDGTSIGYKNDNVIYSRWSKVNRGNEGMIAYNWGNLGNVKFCYICYTQKNLF